MHRSLHHLWLGIMGVAGAVAFPSAFESAEAADDRLLVGTLDDRVEIYDVAGGSSAPGPVVALPEGIEEMERSAGGAWLYVAGYYGNMFIADSRVGTFSTTPGSVGAGVSDLAVSPNRSEVYLNSGGHSVVIQDGAGAGPVGTVMLSSSMTGSIDRLAATHAGDRVYGWDGNTGELREWDLASGRVTTVAMFRYDVWEMEVSADDSFVVLAGPDTWGAAPLGDPTNPAHIIVYSGLNGLEYHAAIAGGDVPVGIAFDSNDPSKFWVGTYDFVQPVTFTHTSSRGEITLSAAALGQSGIRDVDSNENGGLYVLYDDRIELYSSTGTAQTVATLNDDRFRLHLEVVPALSPPADRPSARMRSRWDGLIEAALERRWRLPWKLRAEWVDCTLCDEQESKQDYEDALAYLAEIEQDRFLDVAEVSAFLAGARGSDSASVPEFLDELFVAPAGKPKP